MSQANISKNTLYVTNLVDDNDPKFYCFTVLLLYSSWRTDQRLCGSLWPRVSI